MDERITHSFTFDGIDVEDLGLHYAPDLKGTQTYSWAPNTAKIHEVSFEAHDGGYYYGRSLGAKELTLRCYYEQTPQEEGLMAAIHQWFYIGHKGQLVFERRPWLYYDVVITRVDIDTMYNFQNGLVTITCKAYKPYAISNTLYNKYTDTWDKEIVHSNTNIWTRDSSKASTEYPTRELITTTTTIGDTGKYYYLYNAGDKQTNTAITIKANTQDASGLVIRNINNYSNCKTQPLDTSKTITIDGDLMMTYDSSMNMCYQYHKSGYMVLEPDKYLKDVTFTLGSTANTVVPSRELTALELVWLNGGRAYLYPGNTGTVYNIVKATKTLITCNSLPSSVDDVRACTLNKIYVWADNDTSVETLTIDYSFKFD